MARIVVVVGMAQEAEIVRQACPNAIVVVGAGNAALLSSRMNGALAEDFPIDRIISIGICGALNPSLRAGDIVVGTSAIYGLSQIDADPSWRARLYDMLAPNVPTVRVSLGWFACSPTAVARLADKAALRKATGGDCVDEETFIAGSIAAAHGLPWAALRVVCDPASFELPPAALVHLKADGTNDMGAILESMASDPGEIPELIELYFYLRTAMVSLRSALASVGPDFAA